MIDLIKTRLSQLLQLLQWIQSARVLQPQPQLQPEPIPVRVRADRRPRR